MVVVVAVVCSIGGAGAAGVAGVVARYYKQIKGSVYNIIEATI